MVWIVLFWIDIGMLKCVNNVFVWFLFILNFVSVVVFFENRLVSKIVFLICVFVIFIW